MKIAVFGGSFNPIHIGHLILADYVCSLLEYDKIIFVPAFNPPHKEISNCISSEQRIELIKRAVSSDDRFTVDTCEIDRKGVSYTFDTICYLEEKYSEELSSPLGLIIGDDLLQDFHKWYKVDELVNKVELIVANRPITEKSSEYSNKPTPLYEHHGDIMNKQDSRLFFKYNYSAVPNPEVDISSTDIRNRIAQGKAWRYLVPPAVFDYIVNGKLYGYGHN